MLGFPAGSVGQKSACNAGDPGSIPGSGRSPGEGNGNPLEYFCLTDMSCPDLDASLKEELDSKTVFPNPGGSAEELYSNGSKGRVADEDQDVCKVYIPLIRLRCLLN